jgi:hypothetical protein
MFWHALCNCIDMSAETKDSTKYTQMKDLVRILMGSSLYFDLTLDERRDLIVRLLTAEKG